MALGLVIGEIPLNPPIALSFGLFTFESVVALVCGMWRLSQHGCFTTIVWLSGPSTWSIPQRGSVHAPLAFWKTNSMSLTLR